MKLIPVLCVFMMWTSLSHATSQIVCYESPVQRIVVTASELTNPVDPVSAKVQYLRGTQELSAYRVNVEYADLVAQDVYFMHLESTAKTLRAVFPKGFNAGIGYYRKGPPPPIRIDCIRN